VASLRIFGLVQTNALTAYSVQISSAAEMLLLAFALADTVRHERDAREHAQQQALASSEQLMQVMKESEQRLENAVEERTAQLNLSLATEKAVLAQYVRFGSLISHEFRNPLGIIDSQVALMKKSPASAGPDHLSRLDAISSATQRLVKMFDQWLADGQVRPDLRPMTVVPVSVANGCRNS
jgi:signal transduction histidine kinase